MMKISEVPILPLFGLSSSAPILSSVLQHHFNKHCDQGPDIVSLLQDSFCVDDLANGASNGQEANRIYEQSSELVNDRGFYVAKWIINLEGLRAQIDITVGNLGGIASAHTETVTVEPHGVVDSFTPESMRESKETVAGKPDDVVESSIPGSI